MLERFSACASGDIDWQDNPDYYDEALAGHLSDKYR